MGEAVWQAANGLSVFSNFSYIFYNFYEFHFNFYFTGFLRSEGMQIAEALSLSQQFPATSLPWLVPFFFTSVPLPLLPPVFE